MDMMDMKKDMTMTTDVKKKARANRYALRARLKHRHPDRVAGLTGAALKQAVDKLEAEYNAPKRWRVQFGRGQQRRRAFMLYQACLKLHIQRLMRDRELDSARKLNRYVRTLDDAAPRVTEFYDYEWKIISQALRPQGNSPHSPRAKQAYSVYQWVLINRVLIEGSVV